MIYSQNLFLQNSRNHGSGIKFIKLISYFVNKISLKADMITTTYTVLTRLSNPLGTKTCSDNSSYELLVQIIGNQSPFIFIQSPVQIV